MRPLTLVVPLALLAACVAPAPEPPPIIPPAAPPPAPPPPVAATSGDWRDWPLTPGDWSYAQDAGGSTARFGQGGAAAELLLRCDRATRRVTLAKRAAAGAAPNVTVRTTSSERALALQPTGADQIAASLAANDPLLDAMGFSRGRFLVQQPGGTTLVVPAWAEILRVTEDCRG